MVWETPTSASAATYSAPFGVSQTTTVRFASSDNAGNQEAPRSQLIQAEVADTTPPTTAVSCNGSACSAGWYSGTVSVTLTPSDAGGSGVAQTRYTTDGTSPYASETSIGYGGPIPVQLTSTIRFSSVDNAGVTLRVP